MPDLDDVGTLPPDPHRLPPSGEWFAADAARHLLDRPRHCPMCGASLLEDMHGMSVEYWRADERVFFTWCWSCEWTGEIVKIDRVVTSEPEH